MKDIVINRIPEKLRIKIAKSHEKNLTFKWTFPDETFIRTHLTSDFYTCPNDFGCDGDCKPKSFKPFKSNFNFAEKDEYYTYNPWYFFGSDFAFTKAENNFNYLEKTLPLYDNFKMALFSEYLEDIKNHPKKELMEYD